MLIVAFILSASLVLAGAIIFTRKTMKIHKEVAKLNELSVEISSSAEQVANVSQDIGNSSLEQLDTLNSTVSASHEIRSMIERTTETAAELHESAKNLTDLVHSGQTVVDSMVESSQKIKLGTEHFQQELQSSMEELNTALHVINEIANKTQIINEIVFQTKLLSFNASVEAARAGEAGKGFAVVAEEIGKLAQMSGNSAEEISTIVSKSLTVVGQTIQNTKEKINTLTHDTLEKSEIGFQESQNCKNIFDEMGHKISETVEKIAQITSAAQEQSLGVAQLDQSILKFQEVTNSNKLVASQSTNHSIEFEKQTSLLITLAEGLNRLTHIKKAPPKKHYKKFIWNNRLMLNINKMDEEHKILVDKINALVDSLAAHNKQPNLSHVVTCFTALASYTTEHFADEEAYMESIGYPQLSSHKRIHAALLKQVGQFGADLKTGRLDDMKLISFLRNWLISHIMGVDMQYSHHAHSQGPNAKKNQAA